MGNRRKRITGHAEGEHGPKTEAYIKKQWNSAPAELSTDERLALKREAGALGGKRRLVEGRQQRDRGEKNSERNRAPDDRRS